MIGWLLKIAGGLSGRLWGALALAGVLAAAGAWAWHSVYDRGYQRGSADVRQEWGADVARRERAWRGEIQRQVKLTQEIERGLKQKLDVADASISSLADRLLRAQRKLADQRVATAVAAASGQADGAGGVPEGSAGAGEALAAGVKNLMKAGASDATRLTELQQYTCGIIHGRVTVEPPICAQWTGKIVRDPAPFTNSEQTP